MFGWFFRIILFAAFVVFMLIVPVGSRTLWGHISNIWEADQTKELVDGVKESSGPLVDKIKRSVEAGKVELQREVVPAAEENLRDVVEKVEPAVSDKIVETAVDALE